MSDSPPLSLGTAPLAGQSQSCWNRKVTNEPGQEFEKYLSFDEWGRARPADGPRIYFLTWEFSVFPRWGEPFMPPPPQKKSQGIHSVSHFSCFHQTTWKCKWYSCGWIPCDCISLICLLSSKKGIKKSVRLTRGRRAVTGPMHPFMRGTWKYVLHCCHSFSYCGGLRPEVNALFALFVFLCPLFEMEFVMVLAYFGPFLVLSSNLSNLI